MVFREISSLEEEVEGHAAEEPSSEDREQQQKDEVTKRVQVWARGWLQKIYDNPMLIRSGKSFDYDRFIERSLDSLTGHSPTADNRIISPLYQVGVETFYEELVNFAEEKARTETDSKKLGSFAERIHRGLMSMSRGTMSHLGLTGHLLLTARTSRIPEIQGWFGQNMTDEMVYKFSFTDKSVLDEMIKKLKLRPVVEQIDVLNQLQTVGAHALATGYSQQQGFDNVIRVISEIGTQNTSPLIRYEAEAVMERLKSEEGEPSFGVVTTDAARRDARMEEPSILEHMAEHNRLSRQVIPDTRIEDGNFFVHVAKDAIGVVDHGGILNRVGRIDAASLPDPKTEVSYQTLHDAAEFLRGRKKEGVDRFELERLIGYINHRILLPQSRFAKTSNDDLPRVWHEIVPAVSLDEFQKYFRVLVRQQEREERQRHFEKKIFGQTEQVNAQWSETFLEKFRVEAPYILKLLPADRTGYLEEKLDLFLRYLAEGSTDRSFAAAEDFVHGLAMIVDPNPTFSEAGTKRVQILPESLNLSRDLIEAYKRLDEDHQRAWRRYDSQRSKHFYGEGEEAEARWEEVDESDRVAREWEGNIPALVKGLQSYLNSLLRQTKPQLVPIKMEPVTDLANDKTIMPFSSAENEDIALLLQDLHRPHLKEKVEEDLGIKLAELSLVSQLHFLRFLVSQNEEGYEKLRRALSHAEGFRVELLNAFLIVSVDTAYGRHVLDLGERLSDRPEIARKVFEKCNSFLDQARAQAADILRSLREEYPELNLTEDLVTQALISRGKDFLKEVNEGAQKGRSLPTLVDEFVSELTSVSLQTQVIRTHFKAMAELLNENQIDLSTLEQRQSLVLNGLLRDPRKRSMTLSILSRMEKLEPIPEIHWRVDRGLSEYDQRLGIDVVGFLKENAGKKPRQKLLEIGPGSGVSKEERARAGLADLYNELALSDKIYYPLAPVIEKLLDFEKLQQDGGEELNSQDRKLLADFIYKCLIITKGQTAQDRFEYDTKRQKALASDINELKAIIPSIGDDLKAAEIVPQHISSRDSQGNVIYPYKIKASEQSTAFQKAKVLLAQNLTLYLRQDWQDIDYHQLIDAFPPNVLIGDLHDIKRLSPNQIDVELAVRSTVYARGEEYMRFLSSLFSRLAKQGLALDDSIRDNDGWYYRIGEVWEAKKSMRGQNLEILVILGPGFEGEDLRQDLVPLAMIATRDGSSKASVVKHLRPGTSLVDLNDLVRDENYLRSLDRTGWTAERAQAARTI